MSRTDSMVWCDGCGVEITWAALVQVGKHHHHVLHYCCQDCLEGRECECGKRLEDEEDMRRPEGNWQA